MSTTENKNIAKEEKRKESLLVTKESISAASVIFFFLAFLILCTRSLIFGDLGLAVHCLLTGVFGYLAYPLVLGALYLSAMMLIGKRLVKNRKLFALLCLTFFCAALIVHTSLTFHWGKEDYLYACLSAGENFPNTTVAGVVGGVIVFGVSAVLSNIGAIVFFSAMTLFLGYVCAVNLFKSSAKSIKEPALERQEEKQEPVKNVKPKAPDVRQPRYEDSIIPEMMMQQRPGVSLREETSPQPKLENYGKRDMGAFSPFGTPTMMAPQEEEKPAYESSREFLFGSTPADNYKTNLIFDPNASVNKRPPVDPSTMAKFTPSYTAAYEDSVNEEPKQYRPEMVVSDYTQRQPDVTIEEPQLEKMSFLAEERPAPLETASYDEPPTPLVESYTPPMEEVDFKALRKEEKVQDEGYKRHEYMELFSSSNPRLFEQEETPMERTRDERFSLGEDRTASEGFGSFSSRETFLEPSHERFEENTSETRGRDGLNIFDEPEEDPYTLRSDFEEKPELGRGRNEARGAVGFTDREELPNSRGIPEDPKPIESVRAAEPLKKPEPPKPIKPRVIKPYKRVPLDDFDCRDIEPTQNEIEVEETKQNIIAILEEFKVTGATVASVSFGPTVTRYNIALPRSVSPQKIVSLDQSIALGLRSSGVNIYPNYEDGVVSIEVPNKERQFVKLGCMLSGNSFVNAPSSSLMFAIGKNVANTKIYGDISKMIHMLVAGSSGSGKSVFLGSLIISLIYKYSPEELRLILIDPKKTEFVLYNNLPHLMINEIITDANKAVQSLNWAIGEMNRRYGLFEQMSRSGSYVVNLDEYNAQLVKRGQKNEKLPKIVIIIDELADLMLAAKKEMEDRIQNLTQKARAAGIHLIVATQRPSTDVITGVIKSNLATRIAFYVASDVDSRVILDQTGAQKLLGKGDLLYTMPGVNTPVRVQSAFISPEDSQKVVNFIKANNEAYYDEEATAYINNTRAGGDDSPMGDKGEVDPMYIEALRHVILSGSASISMIQRKCSAGYNRAGRIIEWMEEMGYISAFDGAKARKVLITKEEFESLYGPLQ